MQHIQRPLAGKRFYDFGSRSISAHPHADGDDVQEIKEENDRLRRFYDFGTRKRFYDFGSKKKRADE